MASVYSIEIDGWGEVGPAIDITNAEGFADGTFTLTTSGTPPGTDEIGAMIWVEGCNSVISDGYYTLTARTATTFTMQAAVADVTVTSYAPTAGLARIEDHFKISDGLPSWVTGSNAQARWYRDLIGVSESAGQSIKPLGGIATVDGFEFTAARRQGLAAILADTYLLDTKGPVVLGAAIDGSAATIITKSAVPYAGESTSSPTGPAQPAWVGTEAIDVRGTITDTSSADGVTTYTMTHNGSSTFVARGVLRTFARSHAKSTAVFGGLPTPIGQVARAYDYPDGHASHADRTKVSRGTAEFIDPSKAGCSAQSIGLASALFTESGITDDVAMIDFNPYLYGFANGASKQSDGSNWGFSLSYGYCATDFSRTSFAPVEVYEDGTESWLYRAGIHVEVQSDFPMVKPAPDAETWDRFNTDRGFAGGAGPRFVDSSGNVTLLPVLQTVSDGSIFAPPSSINEEGPDGRWGAPMCHVVFPTTWARSRNTTPFRFGASRLVEVNPVDAILEILTSTGYAFNGDHDNGPSVFGMGINVDQLDSASFTTVGNRLNGEAITAGTIALINDKDGESLRKRLDVLLQTYGLALATTTSGDIRLIDLTFTDYDTALTLDEGDLVGGGARLSIGSAGAVEGVSIKFKRPWVSPGRPDHDHTLIAQAGSGGLMETLHRSRGRRVSINPWFAASVDPTSHQSLAVRWSRLIAQTNGVVGKITCNVDPGYTGQVGDTVAVTLPAFPNAQDSSAMSGALCRIVDRIHVSRPVGENPHDELTLLAYGVTAADKPREWAPSGVVASVTSKLVFDLKTSTYSGSDYASDAVSFADGVDVDIYDANWSLRSTVSPGTVSSTAGDTVTLSVAAAGGGGDVTPNVGDKITLAAESNQSVPEAAKWGWLSTSTPGYLWR